MKLDHLLRRMLRLGMKSGELRPLPAEATAVQLLDFIQAYLFKLAIINDADPAATVTVIEVFLRGLSLTSAET